MDVEIFYAGDAEISVTLKKMGIPITAGLKNMKVRVEAYRLDPTKRTGPDWTGNITIEYIYLKQ